MFRRYIIIIGIICICIVVLSIPFTTIIMPAWRLRVVDVEGNFCPNTQVIEGWGHYLLEPDGGGNENRVTDGKGYVEFPERTVKASLFWRIAVPVMAYASLKDNRSADDSGIVYTTRMIDKPWINYKPDEPMPDKIVVDSCNTAEKDK